MFPFMMFPFAPFYGNAPLSGPVSQAFNMMNDWVDQVGQVGLVNIDLGNAGNLALEQRILGEVASYGRQLGQISDALKVLLDQSDLDRTKLSDEDIVTLHKFRELLAEIDRVKAEEMQPQPRGTLSRIHAPT